MRKLLLCSLAGALLCTAATAQTLNLQLFRKITHTYPGTYGTIGCTWDGKAGLFHVGYFPTGTIYSFNIAGKFVRSFTTAGWTVPSASPNGITWSQADGLLYLVDNTAGMTVTCCDSTGKYVTGWAVPSPSTNPVGIAWNRDKGTLNVSSNNMVTEWTTQSKQVAAGTINNTLGIISGVAYVPQTGNFLLTKSGSTSISEYDQKGTLISTTPIGSHGVTNIQDIDYDPETGFLTVVCNSTLTLYVFVYKPAGVITFGRNCPGSGGFLPARRWTGSLGIGKTCQLELYQVLGKTPALLAIGNRRDMFGPLPLPFDLTSIGATGCWLNIRFLFTQSSFTTGTGNGVGTAAVKLALPNSQTLIGATFFDQWVLIDKSANNAGMVFSAGGILRVTP